MEIQFILYHEIMSVESAKVRKTLTELNLHEMTRFRNIAVGEEAKNDLLHLTGKTIVPVLVFENKTMTGSDEIIKFLKNLKLRS